MAAIDVANLRKRYGDVPAVDDVSFTVATGEVFALLGPNGAGKTTTVEILEGYRTAGGGEVSVLGFDPARGGIEFRDRIGIVLQETGIDAQLTVTESLDLYGSFYSRRRPAGELVELVGLDEKAEARVKTLSGGQRRRLDLALALIGDPDIVFLDEPTTGFDPSARRKAWQLVENLADLGKTILLTTHYLDEAQNLADHIAVLGRGRIIAEGTPETLVSGATASTISFLLPDEIPSGDLPRIGSGTSVRSDRVEIISVDPTRDVHALTGWALDRGLSLDSLAVARPSLEDIYLGIIEDDDP